MHFQAPQLQSLTSHYTEAVMRRDTYKKEIEQLKLNKDSEDSSREELTKQAEQTLSEKTEEFYRNEVNNFHVLRFNLDCYLKKYVN